MVVIHFLKKERAEGENPCQGIIDLVGHSCGQLTQGRHLACMDELVLDLLKFPAPFLDSMLQGLSPFFDGIPGPLQF